MNLIKVGVASISTIVGDINTNQDKLLNIIREAEVTGVTLLVTPELGLSGYSLGDRVEWVDIEKQCKNALYEIARKIKSTTGVFIGAPLFQNGAMYNALYYIYGNSIQGAIKKRHLPTYGQFYEGRNYSAWTGSDSIFSHTDRNLNISGQICEDLWSPRSNIPFLCKKGVNVIVNGNASPFAPGKDVTRESLVRSIVEKNNCVYLYSNLKGLEDRLVFDGQCIIATPSTFRTGGFLSEDDGTLFSQVIDLDEIRNSRLSNTTWRNEECDSGSVDIIKVQDNHKPDPKLMSEWSISKTVAYTRRELEDTAQALTIGLKDYFLKNKCFESIIIALSGGRDSMLCLLLAYKAVIMMGKDPSIIKTVYLKHARNSGKDTEYIAAHLAGALGVAYDCKDITAICDANQQLVGDITNSITKQNIQARVRGAYILNLANEIKGLVLVTSNMSEAAVGYCTTGGDNQGGLSLLAGIPKTMICAMIDNIRINDMPRPDLMDKAIIRLNSTKPSAELEPDQEDEKDLMPYEVLDLMIKLFVQEKRNMGDVFEIIATTYTYKLQNVKEWCNKFIFKLSTNQWKRDQHPVGIRVLGIDLDPTSGFRFPIIQDVSFEYELIEEKFKKLNKERINK